MYVTEGGTRKDETRHGYVPQLSDARSPTSRQALDDRLTGLVPAGSVTIGEHGILLRLAAAHEFDIVPTLPEDD